ncbi:protein dead ringer isoform X2 [Episyrphus balteatus]|uniref:protein dead ringer isoform X2 n=1 Tax=Episyrphus balteatus TaxID=286459 RepID=UPI0024860A2B|nr:protein dead ringer isoform X2 [Episyrphus balteatus]XP_055856365.1 protein dead ringer isoform X2 [Episyrphus balteatus]
MKLNMDCIRSNNATERDSDLGDDSLVSNDEHSEDDMRDCESMDDENTSRLNSSMVNGMAMDYVGLGGGGRSPEQHNSEIPMSHHHGQFGANHPLGALGNFMSMGGLHSIPNLQQQHNDVLEKLKMQVRDMKVGLMDQEYPPHSNFGSNVIPTPINTAFTIPPTSHNTFNHSPQNLSQHSPQPQQQNLLPSTHQQQQQHSQQSLSQTSSQSMSNGFSFTSPSAPSTKDVNPASNSSTSSETSNSSQQNNGWSFEEQYKQVRQLYEINDDPKRKEFLDDLFSFMQKRGSPINRLPIMAKSVLDLYELYNLVIARGGLVDVINKKLWQEIIKGLHLPSSITSAAFTLRTHENIEEKFLAIKLEENKRRNKYMKYLYPYECEKKNLSSPSELQAAIDGNRREGRRSSYGQFEAMHNQMQMSPMGRNNLTGAIQQMSPLALVTHGNPQAAAAAAAAHHRLMTPSFGQVPNLVQHEIEQRMMEYLKLIQPKKEQPRQRSQSPETTTRDALNALEMSRVALWSMYHNNTSPPASVNTSPQGIEPQRSLPIFSEALNLSDSPPNIVIKREREREPSELGANSDREDFSQPPPAKRGLPTNMYIPPVRSSFHEEEHDGDDTDHHTSTNNTSLEHLELNQHDMTAKGHTELNSQLSPPVIKSPQKNLNSNLNVSHDIDSVQPSRLQVKPDKEVSNHVISNAELTLLSGMQFKLSRKTTGANGEQQLVVNLELNGMNYEGVLIANPTMSQNTVSTTNASTPTLPLPASIVSNGPSDVQKKNRIDERPLPLIQP